MHTTPWHRSRNTVNRRAVVYRETSELVDWPDEDASGFYGTVLPPTSFNIRRAVQCYCTFMARLIDNGRYRSVGLDANYIHRRN